MEPQGRTTSTAELGLSLIDLNDARAPSAIKPDETKVAEQPTGPKTPPGSVTRTMPPSSMYPTCGTEECKVISKVIRDQSDTTEDPCFNFYGHVCGSYHGFGGIVNAKQVRCAFLLLFYICVVTTEAFGRRKNVGSRAPTTSNFKIGLVKTVQKLPLTLVVELDAKERRFRCLVLRSEEYTSGIDLFKLLLHSRKLSQLLCFNVCVVNATDPWAFTY